MSTLILASSACDTGPAIGKYLNLPKNKRKTLFIRTAADDKPGKKQWLEDDHQGLIDGGFTTEDFTFEGKTAKEVDETFAQFDVLYFSGGNTFFLLQEIQKSSAAPIIRKHVEAGKIYIGSSAGSIVAGPDVSVAKRLDTLALAPDLKGMTGLKLVNYCVLPHWGSEKFRNVYLKRIPEAYNDYPHPVLGLHDNEFAVVIDGKTEIVRT